MENWRALREIQAKKRLFQLLRGSSFHCSLVECVKWGWKIVLVELGLLTIKVISP